MWTTRRSTSPTARRARPSRWVAFWSGLHGKAVKGINPVTLFYGEAGGRRVPVNFRVVDKAEGKTKNELFRDELFRELGERKRSGWGLTPAMVTAESGHSGVESLKFLRDRELRFIAW